MNIILVRQCKGTPRRITLAGSGAWLALGSVLLLFGGIGLLYGGYLLGQQQTRTVAVPVPDPEALETVVDLLAEVRAERVELTAGRDWVTAEIDAVAERIGALQARMTRLDALGERLVKVARLDGGEFDFTSPPPQGGPAVPQPEPYVDVTEVLGSLQHLIRQLDDRERQLIVMQNMLLDRDLQSDLAPTGQPVERGWISSGYGMRRDPVTGESTFHAGVDFVARRGADVMAVASGVVVFAGVRGGYGRVVDIDHGNGYVTRYAHNKENLVKVGALVSRGDVIALLGESGRTTGPHVHFEVLADGRPVDPTAFILASPGGSPDS